MHTVPKFSIANVIYQGKDEAGGVNHRYLPVVYKLGFTKMSRFAIDCTADETQEAAAPAAWYEDSHMLAARRCECRGWDEHE